MLTAGRNGVGILVSDETRRRVGDRATFAFAEMTRVKGRTEPIRCHTPLPDREIEPAALAQTRDESRTFNWS